MRLFTSRRSKSSKSIRISILACIIFFISICGGLAQPDTGYEAAIPNTYYDSESLCRGEWKYPLDCNNFSCDYKASWEYRDYDDHIVFTISTKNRNKWTGIGFSDNQAMPGTDAILGLVEESGRFFLMDSWLQAYEAPPLDPMQNLYNQTAWRENGVTTLKFSRPRQTGDSRDYQFSDADCPYFIFPVMGGVFNAVNKRIRKHESTPVVSDRRICVRSCRAPTTTTTTTTATTSKIISTTTAMSITASDDIPTDIDTNESKNEQQPPEEASKIYRLELKLLNFLTPQTKKVNSEEYQDLLGTFEEALYHELKRHFDRVRRVEVIEVISEDKNGSGGGGAGNSGSTVMSSGNVLAIIDLTVGQMAKIGGKKPVTESDETSALTVAMNSVIQDRLVERFSVDPNYLVVGRKDSKLWSWINNIFGNLTRSLTEDEQKWIIIGAGISALVLLALIQALCMFCRCCQRGRSSQQEEYLEEKDNVDKQWKEYSHEQYNGGSLYHHGASGGYGAEDYNYGGKSGSLHKNYRNGGPQERGHYAAGGQHQHQHHHHNHHQHHQQADYHNGEAHQHVPYHPSLDRRNYDQQAQYQYQHQPHQYHSSSRRGQHTASYDMHQQHASHLQPDFYFMRHQRKTWN